jgi:hypothetical protein
MLNQSPAPMNAAQRAWQTRRAKMAIQADRETLKAGVATPAPAFKESKPVVDIDIDHHATGCGMRRFVVLDCGQRLVRLFYYPTLTTIAIDRLTFDRKAKYARDSKPSKIAEIIRRNVALADKINEQARSIVVSDGGADVSKALEVLR